MKAVIEGGQGGHRPDAAVVHRPGPHADRRRQSGRWCRCCQPYSSGGTGALASCAPSPPRPGREYKKHIEKDPALSWRFQPVAWAASQAERWSDPACAGRLQSRPMAC
ncbi:hypothetical protein DSL92_08260 [Billgrantia gudaonensis]|uniref:Uncharacterized protein n=1 Tax=Billgrantia gudaonensis TaxID=376427 RepID=A0A3S0QFJ4_9GAMM|nr:hypothetical protein DSL92_08260 [Halomonas gudaonensis]